MDRYFFDVAAETQVQIDTRGRYFEKPEAARDFAELIALDLECSNEGDWENAEVRVHDASGGCLFSILVRKLDLIAA